MDIRDFGKVAALAFKFKLKFKVSKFYSKGNPQVVFQKYRFKNRGTLLLLLADIVVGLRVVVAHEGGEAREEDVADHPEGPHV